MNKFTKFFMAGAFAAFGALAANAEEVTVGVPAEITINPGETITIPVDMTCEEEDIVSIAFELYLPEGTSIVKDKKGRPVFTLNDDRKDDHVPAYNEIDGHWKVAIYSPTNSAFSETSGELFSFQVVMDVEPGTYEIKIAEVSVVQHIELDGTTDNKDIPCNDAICRVVVKAAEIQNAEAHETDNATLNALTEKVTNMIEGVKERLPNFASEDEADVVRRMIDDLGEEVDDAWDEAKTTRIYVSPVTDEKIAAIEKAAADYVAAVEARATEAYDKAQQDAAADGFALQTLGDDLEDIPANLAGYYDEDEYDDLYMEWMMAFAEMQGAFEAAADGDVPEYVSPFQNGEIEALQNKIAKFIDDAQTLKEKTEAEIEDAFKADVAAYNALEAKVQDTRANIEAEYPAYVHEGDADAVLDALNDLYEAMDDAKAEALNTTHVYVSQVTEEAKDKVLKALDDFCAAVVARFDAAFDAAIEMAEPDMDKLSALEQKVQGIANDNEKYDEETYEELLGEITALESKVSAAAMDAATNNTEYVSPVTEEVVAALEKKIADFEEDAKLSGIYGIGVDAKGTHYFDMQGVRVANPAPGKMYIRVVDGKATKVIVK